MPSPRVEPSPTLKRALGRWDLTAIGINQVMGVSIFLIPSQLVALIGNWSPIAFVLAGLASLAVALCFAEVGSRFAGTCVQDRPADLQKLRWQNAHRFLQQPKPGVIRRILDHLQNRQRGGPTTTDTMPGDEEPRPNRDPPEPLPLTRP